MPTRTAGARVRGGSRRATKIVSRALRVGPRDVPLYSGALHYFRVARDLWRPSLEALRDLGLPMVETYVPWGVHETAKGEFDFGERNPRNDLGAFLDLAHELGLLVFLRPGPHINGELTWFGIPERILYDKECQARSPRQNPVIQIFPPRMFPVPSYASTTYHAEVGMWFDAVARVVKPRLHPDGPVVMVQVDNEGAYYFRNAVYDQDYHPDAIAGFRRFLERKYASLESLRESHRAAYLTWDDVRAPSSFQATTKNELVVHLDWAAYQEELIADALGKMRARLEQAGIDSVPFVHNLPLGESGLPMSIPGLEKAVDLVGLDYYHTRSEHRTIKRRSLLLAGTTDLPYAPELGVGAPPWFTPLAHEDSLFTALCACAYGLRGFNLYMVVDRDRWYGAPIDSQGTVRVEAGAWKHLVTKLQQTGFHGLERVAEVALMMPREYARLSRATHLLGPLSPATIEAFGGSPVDACRRDDFGFDGAIQSRWWRMLACLADALTSQGIPYVYVDGDVSLERLRKYRIVLTPTFEYGCVTRWKKLAAYAADGGTVVYGPSMPTLDDAMRPHLFEVPRQSHHVDVQDRQQADRVVQRLAEEFALERPFWASPFPLETTVHEDENGAKLLFVINPGLQAQNANVQLPGPLVVTDLMNGERFDGEASLHIPMGGRTCRVFHIEHLASPAAVRRRAPQRLRKVATRG